MKLTTKSEYSILALLYMAKNNDRGHIKIDEICAAYGIPKKYLEQLLTILKQSGMVKATRGSRGGYMLSKNPNEINLADIIRIMDGALAPTHSVSEFFFDHTPIEKESKVLHIFKDIRDYISNKLESTTLADLI
jgi:Rrf2 family protein